MNESQAEQIARLKAYLTARVEEWDTMVENGDYIVDSVFDNLTPILLANTFMEIDWLELLTKQEKLLGDTSYSQGYNDAKAFYGQLAFHRLNEILESFKEVLL